MDITGFAKIAPHLANPLVLIGFVLMLAYGIHWQLIKSGLLSQVSKKDSGIIIRLFLRYGFWLALTLLLAGVGLSAWNSYMEKEKVQTVNERQVAEKLLAPLQRQLQAKDEQIKALTEAQAKDEQIKVLTEAFTALSKTGGPAATINAALQELEQGHTTQAKSIFVEIAAAKEISGKKNNQEAAEAYRHLGALASITKPKEALLAYQKAVALDPDNADGWNRLGALLLFRAETREFAQAEEAFRKALSLGEAHKDKKEQARAINNLGRLAQMRGDLDKGEELLRKSLEMSEALGSKEGMAASYSNLGLVASLRGELNKAEEMYRKSLEMSEALGNKEGLATEYIRLCLVHDARGELDKAEEMCRKSIEIVEALGYKDWTAEGNADLGRVYEKRGKLDQAEAAWKKSLSLLQELRDPDGIKYVQKQLDDLAQRKAGTRQ